MHATPLYFVYPMNHCLMLLIPQIRESQLPQILIPFDALSLVYFGQVEAMPWISSKHNMGFAFNRTTWQGIRKCARHFCTYDDYNWDWSLQHVSQQCLQKKLYAMIVKGPRVFHIGEW